MVALAAGMAWADSPLPLLVTADDRAGSELTALSVHRAMLRTVRVTYLSGTNETSTLGYTPYCWWATNSTALAVVTSTWVRVAGGGSNVVDFTFLPADLNYPAGRYRYGVGLKDGTGQPATYQSGPLVITGDPYATGAAAVTWTTNFNIALFAFTGQFPTSTIPAGALTTYAINASNRAEQAYTFTAGLTNVFFVGGWPTNAEQAALGQIYVLPGGDVRWKNAIE